MGALHKPIVCATHHAPATNGSMCTALMVRLRVNCEIENVCFFVDFQSRDPAKQKDFVPVHFL